MERFFWTPQHIYTVRLEDCVTTSHDVMRHLDLMWHMCVKHAFPTWRVCMEGKNELGKNSAQEDASPPFWCLWDADSMVPDHVPVFAVGPVCVPVSYPVYLFQKDLPVCVPEVPVTFFNLQDKRTSDLDHADPETGLQQEEEPDFVGRAA
ncbi:hypothetical protein Bbelb_397530 [Branchiostoma belcheri]|nr:hypothetical protein Bbelb_397530 [Branchiostoma belcheri]